ncbi:MAG: ABC transporter ATP-binding protein [Roseinatronobacter sp.]
MMAFENLSKGYWVRGEYRTVIDDLTLTLPSGKSLALLGRNGAGKSTLLQIIAGNIRADSGRVITDGSVSFPVGYSGSFHKDLTGAQNTRFLARAYGVDTDTLSDFVEDFAEIGPHYHVPIRHYSSGMKSRLGFGVSMGIHFDTYLIDEATAVGDAKFKRKSKEVFRARMATSSAIMVTHSMNDVRNYCDEGIVLHNGKLEYYPDIEDAIKRHQALLA